MTTTTKQTAYQQIESLMAKHETDVLYALVRRIGGGMDVESHERMARAACIEVISERLGDGAADALMDELGM